ncbi:MAG: class I SAM-dependent methyltransferase [Pirellulales bacterium]
MRATKDYRQSHAAPERGRDYDARYNTGATAFYWEHFERPCLEKIFTRLRDDGQQRYLDFACGTGRIIGLGASYFVETVGVDVSESMLAKARSKVPQARFILADVVRAPLDLGRFDVITLFRFLLNADAKLRDYVLDWLRQAIRDSGTLIVNNHCNSNSVRGSIHLLRNGIRLGKPRKVLSDRAVRDLLSKHGFRVVEQHGFKMMPSFENRTVLPGAVLNRFERLIASLPTSHRFMENHIYLCRPA